MSEELYKALDDATRRIILDELTDRDGQTLFEICTRLRMRHGIGSSRQAISQHLAVLAEAGLVTAVRSGRNKHHYLDPTPLLEIQRRWLPRADTPAGPGTADTADDPGAADTSVNPDGPENPADPGTPDPPDHPDVPENP